jgi:hypothetical protein
VAHEKFDIFYICVKESNTISPIFKLIEPRLAKGEQDEADMSLERVRQDEGGL